MKPSQELSKVETQSNILSVYGTRADFLNTFHVCNQIKFTNHTKECYFGKAPTLAELNTAYGSGTAEEFLTYQFVDLSEYCGVKEKLSANQLFQLAQLVAEDYKYLKVTEIMLFCRQFKMARYGLFYGSADPMIISNSLLKFSAERKKIRASRMIDDAKKQVNDSRQNENTMSYEDYLKLKNKKS